MKQVSSTLAEQHSLPDPELCRHRRCKDEWNDSLPHIVLSSVKRDLHRQLTTYNWKRALHFLAGDMLSCGRASEEAIRVCLGWGTTGSKEHVVGALVGVRGCDRKRLVLQTIERERKAWANRGRWEYVASVRHFSGACGLFLKEPSVVLRKTP